MLGFFHKKQRSASKCMWEGELKVERKLGEGSYGNVVLVQDSNNQYFAAKTAPTNSTAAKLLQSEYKAYKHLGCLGKAVKGLSQIHAFGYDPRHDCNVLVMNWLGASLRDVMELNDDSLPTYSILRIAAQVIRRLQYIHGRGVVHGDIKPRNILCARKTFDRIYIVDFGLAAFYRERRTKRLTAVTTGNQFQGTVDFASRHTHRGVSLSRRDDLESLAFTLVYLLKGLLPWSRNHEDEYLTYEDRMRFPKPTDHLEILAQKESIPIGELCKGLPFCIESFMRYVYDLEFYAEPDYPFLIDLFENGMKELIENGDTDNGERLNIWSDPDERDLFEGHRDEDEMWEKILENLKKGKNADPENEEPSVKGPEAEVESREEYHQPEKVAMPKMTCEFIDAFQAWKPFGSPRNGVEKSEASETQKAPVIGLERNRKSLFGKIRRVIKPGVPDFQTIILKHEEDSWSEDWSLENEYKYL